MTNPRGTPQVMLSNADVSVAISRRIAAMPFAYRNTDGDLLYFVHRGSGRFDTEFGNIVYEPGDYVLIPKGITFSLAPETGAARHRFYAVACVGVGLRPARELREGDLSGCLLLRYYADYVIISRGLITPS